jgi:lipoprotein-releasing system permease protein
LRFETFVALRYLTTSRRRAHVALIALISIVGIAVGVMALIISLALLSGFQDRIRSQMMEKSAHLRVLPERGDRLADPEKVARALAGIPGFVASGPAIEGRGWAADLEGTSGFFIRYRNGGARAAAEGSDARVSSALAARLHLQRGDLFRVISSRTRLSPIGPIPVAVLLRVADVFGASGLSRSSDVEVSEDTARVLSGIAKGAGAWEARLTDPRKADAAADAARAALGPGYVVETWRELNAPLAFALRLEKVVIFATIALIIVVAALNIVSNIALTVIEKKRDLGVMTSMGATPASLRRVYLTLGAVIGIVGTSVGLALGVGLSMTADRFQIVPLPSDVYVMTHVPFAVHGAEVAAVAAFAMATAMLASVLPARAAAKLAPGEAIRLSR